MSSRAIWWIDGLFFATKKAAIEHNNKNEPDRITIPNYCNPVQLANFLNDIDRKYMNGK